jgi:1-acyl-sn-glycerol-3-phosphate acyltransferase
VPQYQLSRIVAGPFLLGFGRPRAVGSANIPASGGAILAANHLSAIDSVYLPFLVDRPVTFSAKIEYFRGRGVGQRIFGMYMKATNQLSIDREGARAAQDTLEAALARLREGQLFGIYPEGTRSPDGKLYRGRPGVAWLALNSGLPVIPVGITGTRDILPPGKVVPRPGRVEIRFGMPLEFGADYTALPPAKARRLVTDKVMEAIKDLTGQEYVHKYASDHKAELANSHLSTRPAPRRPPPRTGHRPAHRTAPATARHRCPAARTPPHGNRQRHRNGYTQIQRAGRGPAVLPDFIPH